MKVKFEQWNNDLFIIKKDYFVFIINNYPLIAFREYKDGIYATGILGFTIIKSQNKYF